MIRYLFHTARGVEQRLCNIVFFHHEEHEGCEGVYFLKNLRVSSLVPPKLISKGGCLRGEYNPKSFVICHSSIFIPWYS